ncbi:phage head closure protein [Dokdonella sp.]|uniref:phage head closure protein n=1 Tax=Dokdonella sp. TaxID=2291710 RepID=UPI0035286AAE
MTFTAQQLAHQIELQRPTHTTDPATGYVSTTWHTYATPYARIDPLAGREFFAAQQVQAESTVKFTLRYREGVEPVDRIIWKGDEYNITAIMNMGTRNRELLLHARKLE